jgi:hypothetical protein
MKKLLLAIIAAAGLTMTASAQYTFYSAPLLETNVVIGPFNSTAAFGVTNLTAQNYPASGGWLQTKGVNGNDPNSTGVTFQFATAQVTTNGSQLSSNLVATVALALDDYSVQKNYVQSNTTFTVTAPASPSTNATRAAGIYTSSVFVNYTNFLGNKWFRVISLNYIGTNQLNVLSARAGFYP